MWMRFKSWWTGEWVGSDAQGNTYYQTQVFTGLRRWLQLHTPCSKKRWVVYKNLAEPSGIPPSWHGWLHYTTMNPPVEQRKQYPWQKEPIANMTGTPQAYKPLIVSQENTMYYEPWVPMKDKE